MAKRGRKAQPKEDNPKIGHNGGPLTDDKRRQLGGYVAEIERWNVEAQKIKDATADIYASAKDADFDVKAIRAIVKERKIDKAKREAFDGVLDAYRLALGMLTATPLGQAAISRVHAHHGMPPTADLPHADVSDPPFAIPEMPAALQRTA